MENNLEALELDEQERELLEDEHVLNSIRKIHDRKKRADVDSIVLEAKEMSPSKVKFLLQKLCDSEKIILMNRRGLSSYRFKKSTENGYSEEKEEDGDKIHDTNEIVEEEHNFIDHDTQQFRSFEVLHELLKIVTDIKEYVSYEVSKLRNNMANDLVTRLKNENDFLREEIKESRNLLKDVLLQNVNTNRHTEINNKSENINEWNVVRNGPSGVIPRSNLVFQHSNRFNVLQNETSGENNNDNNDINTQFDNKNDRIRYNNNMHKPNREKKKPNPVINQYPERDTLFKAEQSFNNRLNQPKKIRIMTDSIAKGIRVKEFNNHLENSNARFKIFPGASIGNLNYYINPTLEQEKPEVVVIHVGINDLLSENLSNASDQVIADQIIEIGKKCTHYGVEKVFISALLACKRVNPNRINIINDLIKVRCDFHGFVYIDHNNIKDEHLWKDGIHLRENGKVILAQNFLDSINNFLDQNGYAQGWD